jgi:hypothetical protein
VPRAMALALGTEGLTGGPDRLFAESPWTQLSAKEWGPQLSRLLWGPLVSALPRAVSTALGTGAGPTTSRGHPRTRLCRERQVGSRQIGHLCRESGSGLSAQMWARNSRRHLYPAMWRELNGALDTSVPSVLPSAHGRGPFADPAVCAESIRACAKRSSLSAKPHIPVVKNAGARRNVLHIFRRSG